MTGRILIGTDEAGYGPNLGPLTVAATAWYLPEGVEPIDLWDELQAVLTNAPARGDQRLFVADSKKVFSPGEGLEALEVAVLAFSSLIKANTTTIDELCRWLSMNSQAIPFVTAYGAEPWNTMPGLPLPIDSSEDHVIEWVSTLNAELEKKGIRLLGIRARIMFPAEFNDLAAQSDSKGVVLSNATLQLVRDLADCCFADPDTSNMATLVVCDKHGGRNRYDELIAQHFDDQFVFRMEESRERSRYRMGSMDFWFRTKAEEFLPVALASMVAKYTREVLMHQFNHFWAKEIPGLKPTQGYPLDAKRFRNDIAASVEALYIPMNQLWRTAGAFGLQHGTFEIVVTRPSLQPAILVPHLQLTCRRFSRKDCKTSARESGPGQWTSSGQNKDSQPSGSRVEPETKSLQVSATALQSLSVTSASLDEIGVVRLRRPPAAGGLRNEQSC